MMEFKEILEVIAALLTIIGTSTGFFYRWRKIRKYYEIIWKKSSSLKPHEILGARGYPKFGFREYYFSRGEDKIAKRKIGNNDNVLVVGNPLSGKTRTIYQALINLEKPYDVIVPKLRDINLEDFRIPYHCCFWRKEILLLDDIDEFVQKQNFKHLIQEFIKRNTIIVASCHAETGFKLLLGVMGGGLFIFGEPINIDKISDEEGEVIARGTGISLPSTFDHNIGSLFLQLDTMNARFIGCSRLERVILRSIKRLYYAGIYEGREIFSIKRVKHLCKQRKNILIQGDLFEALEDNGFIETIDSDKIRVEEAYLEHVIEGRTLRKKSLVLEEISKFFSDDGEALVNIGNRAYHLGVVESERAEYMRVAIKAFKEALKVYTLEGFPLDYAATQNSLGIAYETLAEVEDTVSNCRTAIKVFEEALRIRTYKDFPMDYAATHNNLGMAYITLAAVEDKSENCKKAIEAFEEALTVYNLKKFPIQYAATHNNLGIVYRILAEVENKVKNCKKAIEACEEALKVYSLKKFPLQYAKTQNNLGAAYITLATVENKVKNCKKAIKAFEESLRFRNPKEFPLQYAKTQNNLGIAYKMLAEVENKVKNCKKAIKAFEESLEVCNKYKFPDMHQILKANFMATTGFCSEEKRQ